MRICLVVDRALLHSAKGQAIMHPSRRQVPRKIAIVRLGDTGGFYFVGLDRWEQAVLKKWKSFRLLNRFIHREMTRINYSCFGGRLATPKVLIDRMRYSKNWEGGFSGARYLPPNGSRPARIKIFPLLLLKKRDVRAALGHELVHHWEFLIPGSDRTYLYPNGVDLSIAQRFGDQGIRQRWLSTHSPRFLMKSCEVAEFLDLPVSDFLFR